MDGSRQLEVREERRDDGDAWIGLRGELELSTASLVREALARAAEFDPPRVILDMAGVTWIDSTGLAVLVAARKRLVRNDRRLVVLLAEDSPLGLKLAQTGLDRVLEITRPGAAFDAQP
jgi:anti-sigma B factor antagonist